MLYWIIGGVVLLVGLGIGLKFWHDKSVREYREMTDRAKKAGCPMFSGD